MQRSFKMASPQTRSPPGSPPPAPKRMRPDETLEHILDEALANSDVYIDEIRAMEELIQTRNWYPTKKDLDSLIAKYTIAPKNRCLGCSVDMGPSNPRQYCEKTRCPWV